MTDQIEEVVVDEVVPSTPTQPTDDKTAKPEDEIEVVVEGDEPKTAASADGADEPDELTKLQTSFTELQTKLAAAEQRELSLAQENLNLKKSAPAAPAKPADAAGDEKVSRSQLVAIIKEHGSDPEIMANVIQHIAKQEAQAIRDKTVEDIDHRNWATNLESIEGRAISEDPILSKRPDIVAKLPAMAQALRLDSHPMGRYISFLLYKAGNDVGETDPQKSAAAEATRVADLEKTKGLDKTKTPAKKAVTLTKDQAEMADRFGVSRSLYSKFVQKSA